MQGSDKGKYGKEDLTHVDVWFLLLPRGILHLDSLLEILIPL